MIVMAFLMAFGPPPARASAVPTARAPLSPGELCRAGIAAAELGHAIPPQLMAAIGRVESGRRDPATGVTGAWPWTINAEGAGHYFDTKEQAIAAVEALRARGVRSIDVGCMQVNLKHHPTAFPTLDQAFEPAINADYAARFLTRLYGQTGDWTQATANYHSANPGEGGPYASKVTAVWPEEQRKAGRSPTPSLALASGPVPLSGMTLPPAPGPFQAFQPRQPTRISTLSGGISGQPGPNPGRGLDAYRSMPIRVAMRIPLLRIPPMIRH
jgi:hypothetical protein